MAYNDDLDLDYENFMVSEKLDAAAITAIADDPDIDFQLDTGAGSLSGTTLSLAGQSITMYELKTDLETYVDNYPIDDVVRNEGGSSVRRHKEGRRDYTGTLTMYPNTATNRSNQIVIFDNTGVRMLYLKKETGEQLLGCVVFGSSQKEVDATSGQVRYTMETRNAGLKLPQKWFTA